MSSKFLRMPTYRSVDDICWHSPRQYGARCARPNYSHDPRYQTLPRQGSMYNTLNGVMVPILVSMLEKVPGTSALTTQVFKCWGDRSVHHGPESRSSESIFHQNHGRVGQYSTRIMVKWLNVPPESRLSGSIFHQNHSRVGQYSTRIMVEWVNIPPESRLSGSIFHQNHSRVGQYSTRITIE